MKIIRKASCEVKTVYEVHFCYTQEPTHGFFFGCNKKGELLELSPTLLENFTKCMKGVYSGEMQFIGIVERTKKIYKPCLVACPVCGEPMEYGRVSQCRNCYSILNRVGDLL